MTSFDEHQLNAILWAVWGQGTRRLVTEHPNGEMVDNPLERRWRLDALSPVHEPCPHWADYRACAVPLVTAAARELFVGERDGEALHQLFRQMQTQPWVGMQTIRRVATHADLDLIIEARVWPWLEQKYVAVQPLSQPDEVADREQAGADERSAQTPVQQAERALACVPDFRAQIEPMAKLAYQLHEMGTQIASFAARAGGSALDSISVGELNSCAVVLENHSAYVRRCAAQLRGTALRSDQIAQLYTQRPPGTGRQEEYQWWSDLTTRPIKSGVREEVIAASGTAAVSVVLAQLADESDALVSELGDAFESVGWSRGIVGNASVGQALRTVSARVRAAGNSRADEPGLNP